MPIFIPPSGSGFVDLTSAPLILVNAVITAAFTNSGRIDVPVPVLSGATYACFYVHVSHVGNAGDVGSSFVLVFEDAAIFNPVGWAQLDIGAPPTSSGNFFGCVFIDISANAPEPLGWQCNNIGGFNAATTTISLYGYL